MAELKVINELGINETLLVLETSKKCKCSCLWCYVEINRRAQYAGKSRRDDGDPGTFESTVEKAFGPDYDPADFEQWGIRNRLPIVWAAGTEPWQDVATAKGILSVARQLKLPMFFQARGLNWREVWPSILLLVDNCGLYVSFPTRDDEVLRRFEPGTPPASERAALIKAACDAKVPVMLAVAPFCADWSDDLPGHVAGLLDLGVESVFLDSLHLSPKQIATLSTSKQRNVDKTIEAARTSWGQPLIDVATEVRDLCIQYGAGFEMADLRAPRYNLDPVKAIAPVPYKHATPWPYVDQTYLDAANRQFGFEPGPPILIRWADALACMEANVDPRVYDQPFSWSSLRRWLLQLKRLPAQWQAILQPAAPIRECLRALWNQPKSGPGWRHPFTRVAMKSDGTAHLDEAGNVVMAWDPYWEDRSQRRTIPDLNECRNLEWEVDRGEAAWAGAGGER